MNLFEVLQQLPETSLADAPIPASLFGAFRRKSISFYNGLTDENSIVYWFQSKSFTIDLRLKHVSRTPLNERQGWIAHTCWDQTHELLSWKMISSYQNHIQWPEPAKLHAVGNCILEFSPSNAYVEDWRQQAGRGPFLGLILKEAVHVNSGQRIAMNGGLIICAEYIAYAQSRLSEQQSAVESSAEMNNLYRAESEMIDADLAQAIEAYEVSISLSDQEIAYSTQNSRAGQKLRLDGFSIVNDQMLRQSKFIGDEPYDLLFEVDTWQKDYLFQRFTSTAAESEQWFANEQAHLAHHAAEVF